MSRSLSNLLFVFASSLLFSNFGRAQEYSEIVAFGASLTDVGNVYTASPDVIGFALPVSPPSYQGRFSNGPVWIDFLADHLGVNRTTASLNGGTNYAYAGGGTGLIPNPLRDLGVLDVNEQIEIYLSEKQPTGDELFVVPAWISLNEFSDEIPETPTPTAVANQFGQLIQDLADAGARSFLIPHGMYTPRQSVTEAERMTPFNVTLIDELNGIREANPNVSIHDFELQAFIDGIHADTSSIGVRTASGQACNDCVIDNPNPTNFSQMPNEFMYWDRGTHFTTPAQSELGRIAYQALRSPYLINEVFGNPQVPFPEGTSFFDSNEDQSWGPSIVTAANGSIRFQTDGEVPPHEPPERPFETGFMLLSWDESATDSRYWDGYMRTTLRADDAADANIAMRGNLATLDSYLFTGLGALERFFIYDIGGKGQLGEITDVDFKIGVDYHVEGGVVGNKLSMKVWQVGTEEPELPQLVVYDDRLTEGVVGLLPASSPTALSEPARVDVTYHDFRFLPSMLGDVNQNGSIDTGDIDRLNAAIRDANHHPFFDFNQDDLVNEEDRTIWISDLAGTALGDIDLDGDVDTADVTVLVQNWTGALIDGGELGYAKGDLDGDGDVDTADQTILNQNWTGAEIAIGANMVPEPSGKQLGLLMLAAMLMYFGADRDRR